jgi:hypothetical protein
MRLTALDECGTPIIGPTTTIVTNGFVSVGASAQVEEGDEFVVKNAWGEFCINDLSPSRVKRWDLAMEFCQVDPEMLSLLTGGRTFVETSTAVGGTFGEQVGQDFALELWTKIAGGQCEAGSGASWIYWVFPHVRGGVIGDITFENGPLSMTVNANTQGAGADWAIGPYYPVNLPAAMEADEHIGFVVTSQAPPVETEGAQALASITPPVPASGATAGIPGSWTPVGSLVPASPAAVIAENPVEVVASPLTAWTTGQYVQTATAGTGGRVYWNSTAWVAGSAP